MTAAEPLASSLLQVQRHYRREGFSVVKDFLQLELLEDVRLAVEAYNSVEIDYQRLNFDLREAPDAALKLARHPLLVQLVQAVTRWAEGYLYDFNLFRKPAGAPPTPWHRDGDSLPIEGELCTVWIPLESYDDALVYALGTNRLNPVDALCESPDDLSRLLESPSVRVCGVGAMRRGDVSVHNHRVWHMGPGNATSHFRQAIAFIYVPSGCRVQLNPVGFSLSSALPHRQSHLDSYFSGREGINLSGHHLLRLF